MVGEVKQGYLLLSALRHSPQVVTIHQGDFCVRVCVCVSVREGMLTRLQPLSLWLFGLTEGEQTQNEVWK